MTTNPNRISFSVLKNASKSKPKSSHNITTNDNDDDEDQPKKEFVFITEFDPNKTLIPKPTQIESRRPSNIDLPISGSDQLQFDLQKNSSSDDDDKRSYGLNLRNNNGGNNQHTLGLKDFKSDLERLPDDNGFKEFEDMPIDGYGAALLSRFGWTEDRGIGRNPKGDIKVKQVEKKSFC